MYGSVEKANKMLQKLDITYNKNSRKMNHFHINKNIGIIHNIIYMYTRSTITTFRKILYYDQCKQKSICGKAAPLK